jgi:hypothetical protein
VKNALPAFGQKILTRLILLMLALLGATFGPTIDSRPVRLIVLILSLAISAAILIEGVVRRRRSGQSWNQALAGGEKLMTGNVWADGALFAVVLLGAISVVFFVVFRA